MVRRNRLQEDISDKVSKLLVLRENCRELQSEVMKLSVPEYPWRSGVSEEVMISVICNSVSDAVRLENRWRYQQSTVIHWHQNNISVNCLLV